MKVSTVTGAFTRDYFEFRAETVLECVELLGLNQSDFVPEGTTLLCDSGYGPERTLALRIYFGPEKTEVKGLDAETRNAIDTTA